jgi:hypothetical protein
MSVNSVKAARKAALKTARREGRRIAEAQIMELFRAPLRVRLLFALRVIFRR